MMKIRRAVIAVVIITLILTIILVSLSVYYVAIALVAGALLIGHREFWSLIKRRKLPPFDERVRENTSKSIRNGFIFLILAIAFLMLPFSVIQTDHPDDTVHLLGDTVHLLGGLFVSVGAVYMFSYLFYDRVKPKLSERRLKMLKTFLLVTGISVGAFIISVVLHNVISVLFDIEEAVFFTIAFPIAPLAFAVGLLGSLVIFLKGLCSRVP